MGIKKPTIAYQHPNKIGKPVSGTEQKATVVETLAAKVVRDSNPSETANIRIIAHYPMKGTIGPYDKMLQAKIEPKTAVLALLKRGLPLFEKISAAQCLDDINTDFDLKPDYVETTRAMSVTTYNEAKQHFDPFDVLSKRALGAKIGKAILATTSKFGK